MRFVHPAHAYDSEAEDEEYERWERAQKKLRGENVSGSDDDAAKATTKGKAKGARPSSLLSLEPYLSIDAEAAYTSDASSTSAASNMASLDTGAHIHLPVVAIGVPFPEVFSVVHEQLFYPRRTWDATLLGLSSDVVTPQHAAEALARTSTSELGHKLWFIYRVWVNMLAIGIDDPTMWAAVDRTYSMIVKVVMDYRNHVRGRAEWAGRQLAQLKF
jgi:hypothetical protein